MKLMYKIALVNFAVCVLYSLLQVLISGPSQTREYFLWLGLTCLCVGLLDLFIAIVLFIAGEKSREWAQGFLFSCGVLILLGFAVCSSSFKMTRN